MARKQRYIVAPFRRRAGALQPQDLIECGDEVAAFKRGKAALPSSDGMVFFKIECREDGDVWSEVELLASVGDVPSDVA